MVHAVLTAEGIIQTQINDFDSALSHYRSKAGGIVPGGSGLINEIKEDSSFQNVLKYFRWICGTISNENG
eukprot:gnl/Chilomastix_caulleri/5339.p1 GENE.gnl/Chilomastix_caulleri/5339~~gnl/Chilomastix_caulleri/5339.p1  ORF type:complete len:70 (-),score=18.07 gnl/Chilomastix_caulleri/5339:41-250(-)